jgi:hypothetical protein
MSGNTLTKQSDIKTVVEYQRTTNKSHHRTLEILGNVPGKTYKGKTVQGDFIIEL